MASFSVLAASLYRKAQLSGIAAMVAAIILAILAQIASKSSTAAIIILGLLFTPMTGVFFAIYLARWESQTLPAKLSAPAPGSPWSVSGGVLFAFLVIQIFVYPLLAVVVEKLLYGPTTHRHLQQQRASLLPLTHERNMVEFRNFGKEFRNGFSVPFIWQRPKSVIAVDDLSFSVAEGSIVTLLGPNGSGKSTTLDALAGLTGITHGSIHTRQSISIGICPQKVSTVSPFLIPDPLLLQDHELKWT
jgi:ATP-binding cassette, subfamily A (ABC1), member 3